MLGYTAREVADLLGLPLGRVRAFVRAGFLSPDRGPKGEMRFSFQDLVLLRTTNELLTAKVPSRRVRRALDRLREQLPAGRPLSAVHISADGDRVIVRDGGATFEPESGQVLFDFGVSELAAKVEPLVRKAAAEARAEPRRWNAADWYDFGCELEVGAPEDAREAYERALEEDPTHADAHINLGRLLHEAGDLDGAEEHYRAALQHRSTDAVAAFNLGVVLEDLGRGAEAITAYQKAVTNDPKFADAHYNLAMLAERLGDGAAALRHLRTYKKLVGR